MLFGDAPRITQPARLQEAGELLHDQAPGVDRGQGVILELAILDEGIKVQREARALALTGRADEHGQSPS